MKQLGLIIFTLFFFNACSSKHSANSAASASGGGGTTGPSIYHTVYSGIEDTIVKIQNFRLRTSDGKVIVVPSAAEEVDLQDLQGVTKGLKINLAGIVFPAAAATADIVEIEVDVISGNNRAISADNSSCPLAAPKKLNFYTSAPVTVIAGETYLVKVNFTPLNAIQIDIVTKDSCDCDSHDSRFSHQTAKHDSDSNSDDNECSETTIQRCEIVNRRHEATQIVRPIDEF